MSCAEIFRHPHAKDFMKICIYGAGAIGGYLGVQLARAGADVSLVARGAHLAAMRERGLKLLIGDQQHVVRPRCTDNPAELGPQDFVIVCLKAHSITGVIEAMQPLLGPRTRIVTAVNGISYWYFYKHGGSFEGSTLESIDPAGRDFILALRFRSKPAGDVCGKLPTTGIRRIA